MDGAGVDRAVLVPPTWERNNNFALSAAREQPRRFAVMGRLDPTDRDSVAGLRTWCAEPGMLGVRLVYNQRDADARLRIADEAGFFRAAEEASVPLMLYAPHLHSELSSIAARYPSLRLIIDHLGLPRLKLRALKQ